MSPTSRNATEIKTEKIISKKLRPARNLSTAKHARSMRENRPGDDGGAELSDGVTIMSEMKKWVQ